MQDSATVRLQMINTLQQECVIVQGAIDHLINCRKRLEDNIAQAKAQVSGDATDALDTLRSREIQLLRQIDVIESHHANVLLVQHAKLNQLLGNLKHTLYCARHQQNVPVNTVSDEDMEVVHEVNRFRDLKNPLVTFYCDMNRMVAAIQSFGMVESTGHLMNAEQDDVVSRCLPSRVEEYEDSDHQLLYKTLAELKLEVCGRQQVCVAFPKLSGKNEDWLRMDSRSQANNGSHCAPNFVLPDHLLDSDNSRWLKGTAKQSTSTFEKLVSKEGCIDNWLRRQVVHTKRSCDVVIAPNSSDCSNSCGASESIEMISNPDSASSEFTWLVTPSQQSPLQNSRLQTKKEILFCQMAPAVDIENLGNVCCASTKGVQSPLLLKDRHLWLACGGGGSGELEEDIRDSTIGKLCCANEPCRTFSDCVCDVTCDIRNDLVDKNRKLTRYSELAEWLKNPTGTEFGSVDGKKWLRRAEFLTEMEKVDVSEKVGGNDHVGGSVESMFASDGRVSCDWLKNYLTSIDKTFSVRQDFMSYFVPGNRNEWLAR